MYPKRALSPLRELLMEGPLEIKESSIKIVCCSLITIRIHLSAHFDLTGFLELLKQYDKLKNIEHFHGSRLKI